MSGVPEGRLEKALVIATAAVTAGVVSAVILHYRRKWLGGDYTGGIADFFFGPPRAVSHDRVTEATPAGLSPLVNSILSEVVERLVVRTLTASCPCQSGKAGGDHWKDERKARSCTSAVEAETRQLRSREFLAKRTKTLVADAVKWAIRRERARVHAATNSCSLRTASSESSCESYKTAMCTSSDGSQAVCLVDHDQTQRACPTASQNVQLLHYPSQTEIVAADSVSSRSTVMSTHFHRSHFTSAGLTQRHKVVRCKNEPEDDPSRTYKCLTSCPLCSAWRAYMECPCFHKGMMQDQQQPGTSKGAASARKNELEAELGRFRRRAVYQKSHAPKHSQTVPLLDGSALEEPEKASQPLQISVDGHTSNRYSATLSRDKIYRERKSKPKTQWHHSPCPCNPSSHEVPPEKQRKLRQCGVCQSGDDQDNFRRRQRFSAPQKQNIHLITEKVQKMIPSQTASLDLHSPATTGVYAGQHSSENEEMVLSLQADVSGKGRNEKHWAQPPVSHSVPCQVRSSAEGGEGEGSGQAVHSDTPKRKVLKSQAPGHTRRVHTPQGAASAAQEKEDRDLCSSPPKRRHAFHSFSFHVDSDSFITARAEAKLEDAVPSNSDTSSRIVEENEQRFEHQYHEISVERKPLTAVSDTNNGPELLLSPEWVRLSEQSRSFRSDNIPSPESLPVSFSTSSESRAQDGKGETLVTSVKRGYLPLSLSKQQSVNFQKRVDSENKLSDTARCSSSDFTLITRTRILGECAMQYLEQLEQQLLCQASSENEVALEYNKPAASTSLETGPSAKYREEFSEESELPDILTRIQNTDEKSPPAKRPSPATRSSPAKRPSPSKQQIPQDNTDKPVSEGPGFCPADLEGTCPVQIPPPSGPTEEPVPAHSIRSTFNELERMVDSLNALLHLETGGGTFSVPFTEMPSLDDNTKGESQSKDEKADRTSCDLPSRPLTVTGNQDHRKKCDAETRSNPAKPLAKKTVEAGRDTKPSRPTLHTDSGHLAAKSSGVSQLRKHPSYVLPDASENNTSDRDNDDQSASQDKNGVQLLAHSQCSASRSNTTSEDRVTNATNLFRTTAAPVPLSKEEQGTQCGAEDEDGVQQAVHNETHLNAVSDDQMNDATSPFRTAASLISLTEEESGAEWEEEEEEDGTKQTQHDKTHFSAVSEEQMNDEIDMSTTTPPPPPIQMSEQRYEDELVIEEQESDVDAQLPFQTQQCEHEPAVYSQCDEPLKEVHHIDNKQPVSEKEFHHTEMSIENTQSISEDVAELKEVHHTENAQRGSGDVTAKVEEVHHIENTQYVAEDIASDQSKVFNPTTEVGELKQCEAKCDNGACPVTDSTEWSGQQDEAICSDGTCPIKTSTERSGQRDEATWVNEVGDPTATHYPHPSDVGNERQSAPLLPDGAEQAEPPSDDVSEDKVYDQFNLFSPTAPSSQLSGEHFGAKWAKGDSEGRSVLLQSGVKRAWYGESLSKAVSTSEDKLSDQFNLFSPTAPSTPMSEHHHGAKRAEEEQDKDSGGHFLSSLKVRLKQAVRSEDHKPISTEGTGNEISEVNLVSSKAPSTQPSVEDFKGKLAKEQQGQASSVDTGENEAAYLAKLKGAAYSQYNIPLTKAAAENKTTKHVHLSGSKAATTELSVGQCGAKLGHEEQQVVSTALYDEASSDPTTNDTNVARNEGYQDLSEMFAPALPAQKPSNETEGAGAGGEDGGERGVEEEVEASYADASGDKTNDELFAPPPPLPFEEPSEERRGRGEQEDGQREGEEEEEADYADASGDKTSDELFAPPPPLPFEEPSNEGSSNETGGRETEGGEDEEEVNYPDISAGTNDELFTPPPPPIDTPYPDSAIYKADDDQVFAPPPPPPLEPYSPYASTDEDGDDVDQLDVSAGYGDEGDELKVSTEGGEPFLDQSYENMSDQIDREESTTSVTDDAEQPMPLQKGTLYAGVSEDSVLHVGASEDILDREKQEFVSVTAYNDPARSPSEDSLSDHEQNNMYKSAVSILDDEEEDSTPYAYHEMCAGVNPADNLNNLDYTKQSAFLSDLPGDDPYFDASEDSMSDEEQFNKTSDSTLSASVSSAASLSGSFQQTQLGAGGYGRSSSEIELSDYEPSVSPEVRNCLKASEGCLQSASDFCLEDTSSTNNSHHASRSSEDNLETTELSDAEDGTPNQSDHQNKSHNNRDTGTDDLQNISHNNRDTNEHSDQNNAHLPEDSEGAFITENAYIPEEAEALSEVDVMNLDGDDLSADDDDFSADDDDFPRDADFRLPAAHADVPADHADFPQGVDVPVPRAEPEMGHLETDEYDMVSCLGSVICSENLSNNFYTANSPERHSYVEVKCTSCGAHHLHTL